MKGLRWIAGGASSIAVVVILLISGFQAAMYADFGVYEREYIKYQVLRELDMEMEDAMYVTREMMAYLKGDRERLSVVTTVEGTEQDFFNEQDRLHMDDVQGLFLGGLALRRWAFAVLAAALVFLAAACRKEIWRTLARSFQVVLGILAALILFLGIAMARNFNAVFTKFHEIFFDNDLWIFDPAEDYMIRMLPEGLFFDMVIRIGGFFLTGLTVLLILSIVYSVRSWKAGSGSNREEKAEEERLR
ncbi:MAG: TIGR01906 family membrane protein [Ruminococcus sp.]|jgi:integral membrane protein (TIGR01906 family)|nr:TIGR01906 family membrane protein [uncultured Schaedlerella sp.]MCI8766607.1 TIGR01906 family membrane protein [Ruminococcus sp.]MCI9328239.1 TIGR01906 family membrane protein [Ruminococcus sp.]NBJ00020.1 TIGR01906 family membrane protein [Lachnospiraceae bacterium]